MVPSPLLFFFSIDCAPSIRRDEWGGRMLPLFVFLPFFFFPLRDQLGNITSLSPFSNLAVARGPSDG